jgi:hypothetical protein
MTDYSPRRRGRPPANASPPEAPGTPHFDAPAAKPAELQADATANEPANNGAAPKPRRRRASVGGFSLKLGAPSRPGYQRRWFNDVGNRLAQAEELGYDFVLDKGVKTSSPGSRISRLVGTQANGEPQTAFLMETPDELYAEGVAEKEAVARQVDEAILRGEGTSDSPMSQIPKSETYGEGSIRSDR